MPEPIFLIKLRACNFIKKETLAQVFSCEFCEIYKNTFFHRTPLVAASVPYLCEDKKHMEILRPFSLSFEII